MINIIRSTRLYSYDSAKKNSRDFYCTTSTLPGLRLPFTQSSFAPALPCLEWVITTVSLSLGDYAMNSDAGDGDK